MTMVSVGGSRGCLWIVLISAIFAVSHGAPQNFNFRFNQLGGAPNGQPQVTFVAPLVEGCLETLSTGGFAFIGSVTMVQDNGCNIVVDTPTATDVASKTKMLNALMQRSCSPGQIQMVVTTHGHPDHFGQLNFFPNARHFFDAFEITGNTFIPNGLNDNDTISLTPNVELWSTPGHTPQDTSVVVKNVPCCGTISVVGDLIYRESDVLNSTMWEMGAWSVAVGMPNRYRIICVSDWIVPGHGPMFKVTDAMRALAQCPTTTSPNGNTILPTLATLPPPQPVTNDVGNGNGNGIATDFPQIFTDTFATPPPFDPNQTPFNPSGQPLETLPTQLPPVLPADQPLPTDTTDAYPPMPIIPTDQPPLDQQNQQNQQNQPNQQPDLPLDQQPLQPPPITFPPSDGSAVPTYVQYHQPRYPLVPQVQLQYHQPQAQPRSWIGK